MADPQYLRLQPSKAVVAKMAATIFAGFVQHGQLRDDNEDALVERSVLLAIKLANQAETMITSDEELSRHETGSSFLAG